MAFPVIERTGRILSHTAAVLAGSVLMVIGLGMCVTMITLPVGLPLGLLGFLMVGWGLFERKQAGRRD